MRGTMKDALNLGANAPKKGAPGYGSSLADALFGKTRLGVLALLFTHSDETFHLRQIAREIGAGQGAVQRELRRLSGAGILRRSREGQRICYQANRECPIYPELHQLVIKTAGLADVLRDALKPLAEGIAVAFVYGSVAQGAFTSGSDVDVLVVGRVTFGEVASALAPTQEALQREVNPSVYPTAEFGEKLRAENHFLSAVMRQPKVFLIGGEDELTELAEPRLADRARDFSAGDPRSARPG